MRILMTVHGLWIGSFVVLAGLAILFTKKTAKDGVPGALLDGRGRLSLSQLQMMLWTLIVLSLLVAVVMIRLLKGVDDPLGVHIPEELLIAMGISLGSGALATAIKAGKDVRKVPIKEKNQPRLSQLYYVEEGQTTQDFVDVTRLQNFLMTVIVLIFYVAVAWIFLGAHPDAATLTALPGFDGTLVTLFGISHAAYVTGKMPDHP
jgi:hypothetical protein